VLATGAVLVAEDKKKHECPVADLMCPASGDCEGHCAAICDKAGEGLDAVLKAVAADVKKLPQEAQERLAKDGALRKTYVGPVLTTKVNDRFAKMSEKVEHEVKKGQKVTKEKCTFLTGKLCSPCVDEMAGQVREKLAELKK
jgi:hypothetical protein